MKLLISLVSFMCYCTVVIAQNDEYLIKFIAGNQFNDTSFKASFGAIKQSKNVDEGNVFLINPYFSTISAMGLLATNTPDNYERVTNYIKWYSKHYNIKNGHYIVSYNEFGGNEQFCFLKEGKTVCNDIDAEDSEPAVFCTLLWQYAQKTNNIYLVKANKTKVEKAMQYVIDSLLDTNDYLCVAKKDAEIKYTMDNCEVYQGFLSLAYLEKSIFNDNAKHRYYLQIAQKIKAGIKKDLFNNTQNLYKNTKEEELIDTTCWYGYCDSVTPGCGAIIFPQILNVDGSNATISLRQRNVVENNFKTWVDADTSFNDGFLPAYIAFCFANAGDTLSATKQIDNAVTLFYKTNTTTKASTSQDAGWLLLAKESIAIQRKKKVVMTKKK